MWQAGLRRVGRAVSPGVELLPFPELWLLGRAAPLRKNVYFVLGAYFRMQESQLLLFHVSPQCFPPQPLRRHLESALPPPSENPVLQVRKSTTTKNLRLYLRPTLVPQQQKPCCLSPWPVPGLLFSALVLRAVVPSLGSRPVFSGKNPPMAQRSLFTLGLLPWKLGQPLFPPRPSCQSPGVFCPWLI